MCLANVTKKHDPPLKATRYAWKVFRVYDGCYFGEYNPLWDYANCDELPYPIRKWLVANEENVRTYGNDSIGEVYTSGFHAFLTKKDALRWVGQSDYDEGIVRVKLRGIHTEGMQEVVQSGYPSLPVIVAKEMMIPRGPRKR
jgi:hypothetical protein